MPTNFVVHPVSNVLSLLVVLINLIQRSLDSDPNGAVNSLLEIRILESSLQNERYSAATLLVIRIMENNTSPKIFTTLRVVLYVRETPSWLIHVDPSLLSTTT